MVAPTTTNMNASVAYSRDGSYPGGASCSTASDSAKRFMTALPNGVYAQLAPHPINRGARGVVHLDHLRPVPGEPFLRPFPRRVDAHLRAVRERATRVIEDVDGSHGEPRVALGINVVERHPPRLLRVAYVHFLVDDHEHLGERHEPLPPHGVHHLVRLPGILLVDRYEHEVVEDPLCRHVIVDDLGDRQLEQRQEDA